MTTRNQVLALAASQVGYTERGNNQTKFWADLKPAFQGQPWCAAFVCWVLKQCGSTLMLTGPSAPYYTPSMEAWAKKTGRWKASKDCQPGDVLIFGSGHATHTGFLAKQDGPNYVLTIEGNTSSGSGGSQTNGGGVYRRRRPRSWVRGCIDLTSEYSKPAKPGPVAAPSKAPTGKPGLLVEDGDMGPATRRAMEWYLKRVQDGSWTRDDVRAMQEWASRTRTGQFSKDDVRAIQKKVGAKIDGAWGPNTTLGLQRFLNKRIKEKA